MRASCGGGREAQRCETRIVLPPRNEREHSGVLPGAVLLCVRACMHACVHTCTTVVSHLPVRSWQHGHACRVRRGDGWAVDSQRLRCPTHRLSREWSPCRRREVVRLCTCRKKTCLGPVCTCGMAPSPPPVPLRARRGLRARGVCVGFGDTPRAAPAAAPSRAPWTYLGASPSRLCGSWFFLVGLFFLYGGILVLLHFWFSRFYKVLRSFVE